jgi:hypothetical protein
MVELRDIATVRRKLSEGESWWKRTIRAVRCDGSPRQFFRSFCTEFAWRPAMTLFA